MPRDFTKEEVDRYTSEVDEAKFKEIKGLYDLGCFKRARRPDCHNIIDARWVIIWKVMEGLLGIKGRLTARGFKDKMQELETYAGTTSRHGQRIVNAIAAENPDWVLFFFDVPQAFAKGMTFAELSALTWTVREVEFDIPVKDVHLLRKMIKPIYGLKDAPRAWRQKLHQILIDWNKSRLLYAEPELYCCHGERREKIILRNSLGGPSLGQPVEPEYSSVAATKGSYLGDPIRRAQEHNAEQAEQPVVRTLPEVHRKDLKCILSVHVDDLKGTATRETATSLLQHLESKVGKCKADYCTFIHIGILHEQTVDGIYTHQFTYIDAIVPIPLEMLKGDENAFAEKKLHDAYRSCPGSVAWAIFSRPDISVYVQALQRRAHAPRVLDANRCNLVVRYLRRHPCGLRAVKISHPMRLVGFTDVAFKALVDEPSGLALRGLAAVQMADDVLEFPQSKSGRANLLDYVTRKQRRVVRSTFSAELNGLVDSIGSMLLLQAILHQVYCGTDASPHDLLDLLENGHLYPPIDMAVDARAVFDAISASDICDPAESPLKLHLISVKDRFAQRIIRALYWLDTRTMVADGLIKCGIDRRLLHELSEKCRYRCEHEVKRFTATRR